MVIGEDVLEAHLLDGLRKVLHGAGVGFDFGLRISDADLRGDGHGGSCLS
jgi:hypothetical protein